METFRVRETQLHGRSPRQLQRAAEQGEVQRLHPGIYAAPVSSPDEIWRQKLVGHLERGGPTSALSHRAAAMVHRFEGFTNNAGSSDVPLHDDITVTSVNGWWGAPAISCRLDPAQQRLALVLARRGRQRPTGSYTETELVQGLRQVGVSLMRQPTIEICDRRGRRIHRYFPDFADLNVGLLPEVDGAAAHRGDNNMDRDDRRQNELMRGFHIIRFHAYRIHRDPVGIAPQIAELQANLPARADEWKGNGVRVIRTADGARLFR